ncbi:MAG: GIY-YIG nuclease family protein, partial [Solirubrobacteraceae bacterium]|nr:GIY-YIG nuclease family protein [Solirubrobacteraceae bacterium]
MAEKNQTSEREERLREQRLALPDGPGVYLFKNADDEVIYVGKSLSLRKRVSSHFSSPVTRGGVRMIDSIEAIDFILLSSDAEALLTEQTLITRHEPRFNIQLRDDKSYPFIAVSTDEQYPRIYLTRERRRSGRVYFGPYSNPRRARSTVEVLQKVFQIRSCRDPEPGRRTGSPCLDYHIERCEAPCVGYVTEEHYRKNVDGAIAFLSGNYREIEDQLEARMKAAAAAHEYERAAA